MLLSIAHKTKVFREMRNHVLIHQSQSRFGIGVFRTLYRLRQ